jgi:ABC-type Fe3+/spermidine/putrescine transport system ATPase subunit
VTTIFVTHNQEEAMTMSDRIVVMDDGEFAQIGTPETVYNEPASVFVGDFMGESNLFSGRVTGRDGEGATVETDYGTFEAPVDGLTGETEARLLVRPENLDIEPADSADPARANVVTGEVSLVQLVGATVEYEVDTGAGPVTVAEQSSGTVAFERGDGVVVSFGSEDVRAFTETGDRAAAGEDAVEVAP